MNTFEYLDYRLALGHRQKNLKKSRPSTTLEAMAQYCRVQKTYLSKVFNHGGNLNADQFYLACEFLKFNEAEKKYLELVYQLDQCSIEKRKSALKKEIEKFQLKQKNSDQHLQVDSIPDSNNSLDLYYANPHLQVMHMFLTVDRFNQNPKLISYHLQIPETKVDELIDVLCDLNIVSRAGNKLRVLKDNLHLPADSKLQRTYRTMSRLQALSKIDTLEVENTYNFNAVFSCDKSSRDKIQNRFLEFLKDVQKIAQSSSEDDVFQLSFDLFKWS